MGEAYAILQALKTYGMKGAVVMTVITGGGAWLKARWAARQTRNQAYTNERSQLIATLNSSTTQTLQIVREELKVQQESNGRFFDLLDRNTRAMEKLVEGFSVQSREFGEMRAQMSRIEGAVGRVA